MASLNDKVEVYLGRKFTWDEIILHQDPPAEPYIAKWSDSIEKPKPTDEQLEALDSEADILQASKVLSDARRNEYPTIGDQLDKIYHDGIYAWKEDMILPVKTKFPKEE